MFVTVYRRRIGYTVVVEEAMWRSRYWRPTLKWARWTGRRQQRDPQERGTRIERL
jgi:hypothetical protein